MSRLSKEVQKKSKGVRSKKMPKPLLRGSLKMDLSDVDDHYSLMEHFRRATKKQWGIKDEEYWDMLQEHMLFECPKKHLWPNS